MYQSKIERIKNESSDLEQKIEVEKTKLLQAKENYING
jgi:hypothetical protein